MFEGDTFLACEASGGRLLKQWPKYDMDKDVLEVVELPGRKVAIYVFGSFTPIEAIEKGL